jgi:hypothetical protein
METNLNFITELKLILMGILSASRFCCCPLLAPLILNSGHDTLKARKLNSPTYFLIVEIE